MAKKIAPRTAVRKRNAHACGLKKPGANGRIKKTNEKNCEAYTETGDDHLLLVTGTLCHNESGCGGIGEAHVSPNSGHVYEPAQYLAAKEWCNDSEHHHEDDGITWYVML